MLATLLSVLRATMRFGNPSFSLDRRAYYNYLRNLVLPAKLDPSRPPEDMERALQFLSELTSKMDPCHGSRTQQRLILVEFQENWSFVWSWLSGALKHWVQLDNEPTMEAGKRFQCKLICVFPKVVCPASIDGDSSEPILSFMRKHPELFETIVHVSTYAMDRSDHHLRWMLSSIDLALAAAQMNDCRLASRNADILIHSHNTINLLFSHISTAIRKPPCADSYPDLQLRYALRVVRLLAHYRDETLSVLIRSYDLMTYLSLWCRTLVAPWRIEKLGSNTDLIEQQVESLKYVLFPFDDAVKDHEDTAMVLALRGGILQSMIHARSLIDYEKARPETPSLGRTLAQIFDDILQNLPAGCLASARVLSVCNKAVARVKDSDDENLRQALNTFLQNGDRTLRRIWEQSEFFVVRLGGLREEFEGQGLVACANPEVSSNPRPCTSQLILCFGCTFGSLAVSFSGKYHIHTNTQEPMCKMQNNRVLFKDVSKATLEGPRASNGM
ncbi:hypothetical protein D9758_003656 [Tetrapyrgos nigripes]|uniref:Uncharacterized protein n=1 Tax=Tetrapyrgos nigripes TaxID=182062 RepID=A0A8H5GLW3_9AGAR|nr:hypothetical protein D9758_003656 [Tetrapyrgos nigripes]